MEYKIQYEKRTSVTLSVKGGELVVKAPHGTPKEKLDAIVLKHRRWIFTHIEREADKKRLNDALTEDDIKRLKKSAREYLVRKTDYFSEIMNLKYSRITITSASGRFGSCNSKGNIAYSYRLMLYPEAAREYVVVHELAHLVHMNHSKEFYSLVEKYLPDWKDRKKLLKEIPS